MDKQKQAKFLVEALPHIKKYFNKILVVKYGGNAMIDENIKSSVMRDLVVLQNLGIKVVLVHGGGPEISETIKAMGMQTKFVNGLRYTDAETAQVVRMVLAGKVNKSLVDSIERNEGKAIGICGQDGHMIKCEKQDEALGFVGKIVAIDVKIVSDILSMGYIPVISTVGYDDEGNVYNVNADTAASAIAGGLDAESLILMSDIKGLLEDCSNEDSLIRKVQISEIPGLIKQGIISGGMIPKIECCKDAIRRGVKKVFITDGRVYHSILIEILSDEGSGTMFYN
ncbi:MAG: acetylglutamate kinase [Clostridiales bacterium]|nr:acetylglutamate kinase [Clostridiales bacterium]